MCCLHPKDASHALAVPDDHETSLSPDHLSGSGGDPATPQVNAKARQVMLAAILVAAMLTTWHGHGLAHEAPEDHIATVINANIITFDMPSELEAGSVAFTLTNDSDEDHHAQLP